MDALTHWLGLDYHWAWVIIGHLVGCALALGFDVWDGPVVSNKQERNLHFVAILLWEVAFVCMVLWLIWQLIVAGVDGTRRFFHRMKQTYSLR